MTIAVDFDGTIVTHQFPRIGNPAPNAIEVLVDLQKNHGVKIILFTMRDNSHYCDNTGRVLPIPKRGDFKSTLQEAVDYCESNGIKLYGINNNPSQSLWSNSRKVYANLYIDDTAAGVPMITLGNGETCVDWLAIKEIVLDKLYN